MNRVLSFTAMLLAVVASVQAADDDLRPANRDRAAVEGETGTSKMKPRSAAAGAQIQRRADGVLVSASKLTSRKYPGTKQEAAQAFVSEFRELLGGIGPESLQLLSSKGLRGRTFVRYRQHIDGIPVRGADLVVQVSEGNAVTSIQSHLEPSLTVRGEWKLEEAEAKTRATRDMNASGEVQAERLYVVRGSDAIPVWRVQFHSGNPAGDWEVVVDAATGEVVERQNMRMGSDALGYAYPHNPVNGGIERVTLPNLSSDTRLMSAQTRVFTYFPALQGKVEPNTVVQGASRVDGNFFYGADDSRFSEVQLYWGMETASRLFQSLGFWGFSEPLPGTVYWQDYDSEQKRFVGSDNAFYSPTLFGGKPGMFFYLTSRNGDTSLDTDVIFHEYTHAIVAELVGSSQSISFKALNEGTADYFSSSFLDDPVMAEYAAKIFGSRIPYLRRTDNNNHWPYSVVGEVHADGNIWSGALWDVRRQLGAAVADDIAINAVASLSPTATFFDAASAAITAADEIYGGRVTDVVADAMVARGIYTTAARTASRAITLTSGKHAQGSVPAASPGMVLVGGQQYRIEVPNRATKLTIRLQTDADARFYIRYRVPVMVEDGAIVAEQVSQTGTSVSGSLTLQNIPELQAGAYYVAVVNTTQSAMTYDLQTEITDGDAAAAPAITLIEDGGSAQGSAPAGPFLASRQFAIQVPAGSRALAIRLEGDQDVDLYVRYGKTVIINGTGLPLADFVSETDSSREDMRLAFQDGSPIPEGVYVIGVYNYSSETTRYTVRAVIER